MPPTKTSMWGLALVLAVAVGLPGVVSVDSKVKKQGSKWSFTGTDPNSYADHGLQWNTMVSDQGALPSHFLVPHTGMGHTTINHFHNLGGAGDGDGGGAGGTKSPTDDGAGQGATPGAEGGEGGETHVKVSLDADANVAATSAQEAAVAAERASKAADEARSALEAMQKGPAEPKEPKEPYVVGNDKGPFLVKLQDAPPAPEQVLDGDCVDAEQVEKDKAEIANIEKKMLEKTEALQAHQAWMEHAESAVTKVKMQMDQTKEIADTIKMEVDALTKKKGDIITKLRRDVLESDLREAQASLEDIEEKNQQIAAQGDELKDTKSKVDSKIKSLAEKIAKVKPFTQVPDF